MYGVVRRGPRAVPGGGPITTDAISYDWQRRKEG